MGVQLQMKQGELIALLDGEIDHHGARELREEIDAAAQRTKPRLLTLDFSGVQFMDSSGVGLIIGRYKTMHARGGVASASGLHPPVDRLFRLAGLHRIIQIEPSGGQTNTCTTTWN